MNKDVLLHCLTYNIIGSFESSSCQIVRLYVNEKKKMEMRVTSGSTDVAQVSHKDVPYIKEAASAPTIAKISCKHEQRWQFSVSAGDICTALDRNEERPKL